MRTIVVARLPATPRLMLMLALLLVLVLTHMRRETIHLLDVIVGEVVPLHRVDAMTANAVHHLTRLLSGLLADRHNNSIVVLGVLQVILGKHRITRGKSIPRQRHIFLGDV